MTVVDFGGAALCLAYHVRTATKDLDGVFAKQSPKQEGGFFHRFLANLIGLKTAKEVLDATREFFGENLIPPKSIYVVEEIFDSFEATNTSHHE